MKSFALFLAALVVLAVAFFGTKAEACDYARLSLAQVGNHCGSAALSAHHDNVLLFRVERQRAHRPRAFLVLEQEAHPQRRAFRRQPFFNLRIGR